MKKTYISLCWLVAMALTVSCEKEDTKDSEPSRKDIVTDSFTITSPETKTTLQSGGGVSWEAGDDIVYYSHTEQQEGYERKRHIKISEAGSSATITPERLSADNFYMFFYIGNNESNITEYGESKITFAGINPDQEGTFKFSNLCAANVPDIKNHSGNVTFYNVTSPLEFNLIPRTDVKKVDFKGNNSEKINGRITVDFSSGSTPTVSRYGSYKATTPVYGTDYVSVIPDIDNSSIKTEPFYINVLPIAFTKGFTMTYYGNDGTADYVIGTVATQTSTTFTAGKIKKILDGTVAATYPALGLSKYNNWTSGVAGANVCNLDKYISMSAPGDTQGAYQATNPEVWRLYQARGTQLIIGNRSDSGSTKTIKSVTLTISVTKGGWLKNGTVPIVSGTPILVNDTSLTLTIYNTGTATNGQVNIQSVKVIYN